MAYSEKKMTARIRAIFNKDLLGFGWQRYAANGADNDSVLRAMNAAGDNQLDLIGTTARDTRVVAGAYHRGMATPVQLLITANGKIGLVNTIFTNNNDTTPLQVVRIDCEFGVADGAVNTGYVSKDANGSAPGSGASCMTGTFNLNSTANTTQNAVLAGAMGFSSLTLGPGEGLSLVIASAVTSLAGLIVTVWVQPHTDLTYATYNRRANGDIVAGSETIFLNPIPGMKVRSVVARWGTAATNAGAVTLDITKDTGTTAPGAGTSVLLAALSVKTAANTAMYPALAASAATLTMGALDRLALKMTGTLTALAQLSVTVFFEPISDSLLLIPFSLWDGLSTDRAIFCSNALYRFVGFWETWSTAGTSGVHMPTKDGGTTAPGAGTAMALAGINDVGTANTPLGVAVLTAAGVQFTSGAIGVGDCVGIFNSGTPGAVAGTFGVLLLQKL